MVPTVTLASEGYDQIKGLASLGGLIFTDEQRVVMSLARSFMPVGMVPLSSEQLEIILRLSCMLSGGNHSISGAHLTCWT